MNGIKRPERMPQVLAWRPSRTEPRYEMNYYKPVVDIEPESPVDLIRQRLARGSKPIDADGFASRSIHDFGWRTLNAKRMRATAAATRKAAAAWGG